MFSGTRASSVIGRFRAAKKRIQEYVEDPRIGIDRVEAVIDAAHALQYQINRTGAERRTHKEMVAWYRSLAEKDDDGRYIVYDTEIIPLEPDPDVLGFIAEHGKMPDWKRDVIEVVRDESYYFMPQIQTKIMNEGWASFWHYTICHDLELRSEYHLPILKSHNQVIRPHVGGLNPYHLGFMIFQDIKKRFGMQECFIARESLNDVSFIRQYLTHDLAMELGLFSWSEKKYAWTIDEISDKAGWKKVRDDLCRSVGASAIPVINVDLLTEGGKLILKHIHDGRDLELEYADKTIQHIKTLWGKNVEFGTMIEGEHWAI